MEQRSAHPWAPAAGIVFAALVLAGIGLAGGGSAPTACTRSFERQGPCENGSWGKWAVIADAPGSAACSASLFEQRAYKGTRAVARGLFDFSLGPRADCAAAQVPADAAGALVSGRVACEIIETRMRALEGGKGGSCGAWTGDTGVVSGATRTETAGAPAGTLAQLSGTYRDFLNVAAALQNGREQ